MSCNTCGPKVVIETGYKLRSVVPEQGNCKPEVEPICASYSDVRRLVTNWLYDLDSSVGFGKVMENFVKKSIINGIQLNDETLVDLKNTFKTLKEETLKSAKEAADTYIETELKKRFGEESTKIDEKINTVTSDLDTLITNKKQELNTSLEGILSTAKEEAKTELTTKIQEGLESINNIKKEIETDNTNTKNQIDTKVSTGIESITSKVNALSTQLDLKATKALEDYTNTTQNINSVRDEAISQLRGEVTKLETYKSTLDLKLSEFNSAIASSKRHLADVEFIDGNGQTLHVYAHSETTRN